MIKKNKNTIENNTWILVSTEAFPFSKYGGLADYIFSFAKSIKNQSNYEVIIYSPYYEYEDNIMLEKSNEVKFQIFNKKMVFLDKIINYEILSTIFHGIKFRFVKNKDIYGFKKFYFEQHTFLGKCVYKDIENYLIKDDIRVVIQGNDYASSFFAPYLKKLNKNKQKKIVKLFYIHNQGDRCCGRRNKNDNKYIDKDLKNIIKPFLTTEKHWSEILWSFFDKIGTVSPNYCNELINRDDYTGNYLLSKFNEGKFKGIHNGINNDFWSIKTSPYLSNIFNKRKSISKVKSECKKILNKKYDVDINKPILCFVGRICDQKGIKRIDKFLETDESENYAMVILGEGHDIGNYINIDKNGDKYKHIDSYNEKICHTLLAASDIMLVPSNYEPCASIAMYSTRFGTFPVVRATGGLVNIADRIQSFINLELKFDSINDLICILKKIRKDILYNDESTLEKLVNIKWDWDFGEVEKYIFE